LSFTYQYKIGDTEWSEEQPTGLESFVEAYSNFEWPIHNSLKGEEWDQYKSALILKKTHSLEEIEIAAIDTEAFVICYNPDNKLGYQNIIEASDPSLNDAIQEDIKHFFHKTISESKILSEYEQLKYTSNRNNENVIKISNTPQIHHLNLDSFMLGLTPIFMLFGLSYKLDWNLSFLYSLRIVLIALYLPKIVLLSNHHRASKRYKYIYSTTDNTLFQFKDELLTKTLSNIQEVHFVSEFYLIHSPNYNKTDVGYVKFVSEDEEVRISALPLQAIKDLKIKPKTKSYERSYPWV
jgi:hypothetical protein